jgi:hypothetical protein
VNIDLVEIGIAPAVGGVAFYRFDKLAPVVRTPT